MIYGKVLNVMTEDEKKEYSRLEEACADNYGDERWLLKDLTKAQQKVIEKLTEYVAVTEHRCIAEGKKRAFEAHMESKYSDAMLPPSQPIFNAEDLPF